MRNHHLQRLPVYFGPRHGVNGITEHATAFHQQKASKARAGLVLPPFLLLFGCKRALELQKPGSLGLLGTGGWAGSGHLSPGHWTHGGPVVWGARCSLLLAEDVAHDTFLVSWAGLGSRDCAAEPQRPLPQPEGEHVGQREETFLSLSCLDT